LSVLTNDQLLNFMPRTTEYSRKHSVFCIDSSTVWIKASEALYLHSLYKLLNSEIFASMNFPSVPHCVLNTITASHTQSTLLHEW